MKGLLAGPSAPDAAQLAALGSRNALSPRRATALMRQTLGYTEVNNPLHMLCSTCPKFCTRLHSAQQAPSSQALMSEDGWQGRCRNTLFRRSLCILAPCKAMLLHGRFLADDAKCCSTHSEAACMPCVQLLTPKRRSARKPQAAPASAGRMMAATGFAYAPNEALQARMAHLAAEGKLVLGDAQDSDMLACLHAARSSATPALRHACMSFLRRHSSAACRGRNCNIKAACRTRTWLITRAQSCKKQEGSL